MYKRMLVPLDGSELAEVVFPYARELAGRFDLDVTLLYVQNPYVEGEKPDLLRQGYIENRAMLMKHQSEEMQQKTGIEPKGKSVQVQGELTIGHPAEEILRYAKDNDIDLILMATHGRSGIRRWIMGSVADKVLRMSRVPVWLIRAAVPEEITYDKWPRRTILVPLDGSELAEAVLPHVQALARQRGAELVDVVLLRVCELSSILAYSEYVSQPPARYVQMEADEKAMVEEYLAKTKKRLKNAGLKVRSKVLSGKPAEQIVDYANAHPFNLIAMSTHARSGLSRWAFGSVAAKVLEGVNSPMLLVRPPQS